MFRLDISVKVQQRGSPPCRPACPHRRGCGPSVRRLGVGLIGEAAGGLILCPRIGAETGRRDARQVSTCQLKKGTHRRLSRGCRPSGDPGSQGRGGRCLWAGRRGGRGWADGRATGRTRGRTRGRHGRNLGHRVGLDRVGRGGQHTSRGRRRAHLDRHRCGRGAGACRAGAGEARQHTRQNQPGCHAHDDHPIAHGAAPPQTCCRRRRSTRHGYRRRASAPCGTPVTGRSRSRASAW